MLLEKLTKDLDSNDTPTLQCRKCGGQADFYPVQTRSADEPMTIFCQCLNPACNSKWKM
jgi:DNA-directed RNA polymerase subunit M/transcription elongation factor TFIIS